MYSYLAYGVSLRADIYFIAEQEPDDGAERGEMLPQMAQSRIKETQASPCDDSEIDLIKIREDIEQELRSMQSRVHCWSDVGGVKGGCELAVDATSRQ